MPQVGTACALGLWVYTAINHWHCTTKKKCVSIYRVAIRIRCLKLVVYATDVQRTGHNDSRELCKVNLKCVAGGLVAVIVTHENVDLN